MTPPTMEPPSMKPPPLPPQATDTKEDQDMSLENMSEEELKRLNDKVTQELANDEEGISEGDSTKKGEPESDEQPSKRQRLSADSEMDNAESAPDEDWWGSKTWSRDENRWSSNSGKWWEESQWSSNRGKWNSDESQKDADQSQPKASSVQEQMSSMKQWAQQLVAQKEPTAAPSKQQQSWDSYVKSAEDEFATRRGRDWESHSVKKSTEEKSAEDEFATRWGLNW